MRCARRAGRELLPQLRKAIVCAHDDGASPGRARQASITVAAHNAPAHQEGSQQTDDGLPRLNWPRGSGGSGWRYLCLAKNDIHAARAKSTRHSPARGGNDDRVSG